MTCHTVHATSATHHKTTQYRRRYALARLRPALGELLGVGVRAWELSTWVWAGLEFV